MAQKLLILFNNRKKKKKVRPIKVDLEEFKKKSGIERFFRNILTIDNLLSTGYRFFLTCIFLIIAPRLYFSYLVPQNSFLASTRAFRFRRGVSGAIPQPGARTSTPLPRHSKASLFTSSGLPL